MDQTNSNVLISKLGKTRAGERSRIWLEGKRLLAYGFTKGTPFAITTDAWQSEPRRWYVRVGPPNPICAPIKTGTVAGTAERPIIDTVGALVLQWFGTKGPTVRCEFHKGLIIIEAVPE